MLEETIDILLATGILGYSPRERHILGCRMRQLILVLPIIEKVVECVFRTLYLGFSWTMNPERIVIDTQFQALRLTLGSNILESLRAVMGHIATLIFGKHRDKTIRTNHVIARWFEIGCNIVDDFVPLVGGKIHIGVAYTFSVLQHAILIYTPIERSLHTIVDTFHYRKVG